MSENLLYLLILISPAFFALTAIVSWFEPGLRPAMVKRISVASTVVGLLTSLVGAIAVIKYGLLDSGLIGIYGLGVSIRLDAVSILMLGMIALLSFIIIRFSLNYLDGDQRQGAFLGRLAATVASVQLLVLSGNLALLGFSWILTSMSLHRLLLFYPDRPGAVIASRKKFIVARFSDLFLLIAIVLLYNQFGTGNLETIFSSIKASLSSGASLAGLESVAVFLVLAAIFKSAQFPTHGWIIEVMETPTPVSALLHAGLLNAGPFLIIRMAYVMEASTYAPIILLAVGGFTALFGSVVYLTQTSVKTALSYSSIAHMGFSLLGCGLGVYPAAMLHLMSHSFYKAHSFLSSGSAVEVLKGSQKSPAQKSVGLVQLLTSFALAIALYYGMATLWNISLLDEIQVLFIGAIIVMGLARIFSSAIGSESGFQFILRTSFSALIVALAFFSLESLFSYLISSQVPELAFPSMTELVLMGGLLLVFGSVVILQLVPYSDHAAARAMAIHLRNGLYINILFDRMVGTWKMNRQAPYEAPQMENAPKEVILQNI